MMKECSKCKEVKPYSEFHKLKTGKDGLRPDCKDCHKQYYEENKEKIKQYQKQYREENEEKIKQYREENKEKIKQYYEENKEKIKQYREENKEKRKQWYQENKEKIKQQDKQYYEENKEKIKQYQKQYREENKEKIKQRDKQWRKENKEIRKQYREENKEKIKQYQKQWFEENKEKINQRQKQYLKQRKKTDPIFRLTENIRGSIYKSLKNKGYSKKTNSYKILGLEYEDFYTWLNTEASNGLNFDKDDVHVDHVIPVSFGKTEEQVLALNHYSNLQLLTSEENLNKKNTYIKQSNLDRVMKHHPNNSLLTKILLNYDYLIF